MRAIFLVPPEETYLDEAIIRAWERRFGEENLTMIYPSKSPRYVRPQTWLYSKARGKECRIPQDVLMEGCYDIMFVSRHYLKQEGPVLAKFFSYTGVPVAILDNYEAEDRRGDKHVDDRILAGIKVTYFKCSCPRSRPANVHPISFGFDMKRNEGRTLPRKDINILMIGAIWKRGIIRRSAAEVIEKMGGRVEDTEETPYTDAQYLNLIARARIAVSCSGAQWDCTKHYEIPAQRTLLFIEEVPPNIEAHYPYTDGVDAVVFPRSQEGLEDKLRYYLEHRVRAQMIAKRGYAHILKYHTLDRLLDYVMDKMGI